MEVTFENSQLSEVIVAEHVHVLAALSHRQWTQWEGHIVRPLEAEDDTAIERLLAGTLPADLVQLLERQVEILVREVEYLTGGFAWWPGTRIVYEHKLARLQVWVEYARSCSSDQYRKWRMQTITPFLGLSPKEQTSDYEEAVGDYKLIADAGGLVLPDSFPEVKALSGWPAAKRRAAHFTGLHGGYTLSESPYSMTCQACHRGWSVR